MKIKKDFPVTSFTIFVAFSFYLGFVFNVTFIDK